MEFFNELKYDIENGATVDEIKTAYPELKNNTQMIGELQYDISNGATLDEVKGAYPELSVDTSFTGAMKGAMKQSATDMSKAFTEGIPQAIKGVGEGAYKLGADISKLKGGEFKKEILRQETDPGIEKGLLGKTISSVIKRERAFSKRKGEQGDTGATEFEKGFEKVGQGAGVVGDIFGEVFMSGLETLATDEQEQVAKQALQDIASSEVGQKGLSFLKEKKEGFLEFERQHPRTASAIRSLVNLGLLGTDVAGFLGARKAGQETVKGIEKGIEKGEEVIDLATTTAKDITGKGIEKGKEQLGKIDISGTIQKPVSGLSDVKEEFTTGLSKEQVKGLQSNPYQADEFNKLTDRMESPEGISDIKDYKVERVSSITKELTDAIDKIRATKGETSQAYKDIRNQDIDVSTKSIISDIEETIKSKGLDIKDGEVVRTPGIKAGELNQSDVLKINQLYQDLIYDSAKQSGKLKPNQVLDLRKTASDLAKYDATTTTTGQGIMRAIRKSIDNNAKSDIPGLKELDKFFVDRLDEFENAVKDLVYKSGDVKGEWRSNLVNIIGTLDRANRAKLLKRLDEVVPGIGEKIQAIDNIPTIYKSLQDKGALEKFTGIGGLVAGATTLGSMVPGLGHIAGAILGFTGGKILESGLTQARKIALSNVLSKVSKEGQKRMKEINSKIKDKKLLNKEDSEFIKSLKNKFKDETSKQKNNNMNGITPKSRNSMNLNNTDNTRSKVPVKEQGITPKEKLGQKAKVKEEKQPVEKIDKQAIQKDLSDINKKSSNRKITQAAVKIASTLGEANKSKQIVEVIKEYINKYGKDIDKHIMKLINDIKKIK